MKGMKALTVRTDMVKTYSQEINGKDIPNCMEERTFTGEEKSR